MGHKKPLHKLSFHRIRLYRSSGSYRINIPKKALVGLGWIKSKEERTKKRVLFLNIIANPENNTITLKNKKASPSTIKDYLNRISCLETKNKKKAKKNNLKLKESFHKIIDFPECTIENIKKNKEKFIEKVKEQHPDIDPKKVAEDIDKSRIKIPDFEITPTKEMAKKVINLITTKRREKLLKNKPKKTKNVGLKV